jgi:hypothetical protein
MGSFVALAVCASAPVRAQTAAVARISTWHAICAWGAPLGTGLWGQTVDAGPPPDPSVTGPALIPASPQTPSAAQEEAPAPGSTAGGTTTQPVETFIPFPPRPPGTRPVRAKPLKMTVGTPPTTGDLGSEADTLAPNAVAVGAVAGDEDARTMALNENWSFTLKGYLRAPMRVGYGQSDSSAAGDANPPNELHSPVRMVGASSSNWSYINIAPNPTASLRATIANPRVAATMILSMNQFSGVGYQDLDSQGGMSQAFVTLKFPETFGERGGLAWTVGAFGNRYGYSGPRQVNAGYYGTYLFGRTRVMGEAVTANIDLTEHLELLIEHGFGAEMEILPILGAALPKQMFIPGDPHAQLGSDFLHHAHVALWVDDWLKIATHYLTSWTPNDRANDSYVAPQTSRLSVVGAEVHLDHPRWGNGYLGYSHIWADNLMPLNDALQVIHGSRGYDFKLQYFGNKLRNFEGNGGYLPYDSGRVETILFQHKFYSTGLLRQPPKSRGWMLGIYGMYSHSYSPARTGATVRPPSNAGVTYGPNFPAYTDNKLKYGVDLLHALWKTLSLGVRYDRVQPTSNDPSDDNPSGNCSNFWSPFSLSCGQSYMAITPYIWLQPDWNSTRRITISYTHFFLGNHAYPDSPYSAIQKSSDTNLFMISALMSL